MEANNMKAMHEALVGLAQSVQDFMATKGRNFYPDMAVALEAATAALSEPPRNCDFGTVDEQLERFTDYCCDKCNGVDCKHGLWIEDVIYKCAIKWGQMLYAEGAK